MTRVATTAPSCQIRIAVARDRPAVLATAAETESNLCGATMHWAWFASVIRMVRLFPHTPGLEASMRHTSRATEPRIAEAVKHPASGSFDAARAIHSAAPAILEEAAHGISEIAAPGESAEVSLKLPVAFHRHGSIDRTAFAEPYKSRDVGTERTDRGRLGVHSLVINTGSLIGDKHASALWRHDEGDALVHQLDGLDGDLVARGVEARTLDLVDPGVLEVPAQDVLVRFVHGE